MVQITALNDLNKQPNNYLVPASKPKHKSQPQRVSLKPDHQINYTGGYFPTVIPTITNLRNYKQRSLNRTWLTN